MGIRTWVFFVVWVAIGLLPSFCVGQVPMRINYQGRLLDGASLVNAEVDLVIRLYDQLVGGNLLCEDSNQVTVVDGLYSTYIGDDALPGTLEEALTNNAVFVEIEVDGTKLAPRERLVSVGYSLMADRVPNKAITTAMLADRAVTSNQLALGAVQSQNLGFGAVTSNHIADAAVTADQLADGAVTSNKLAADSVSNEQLSKGYESGTITRSDLGLTQGVDFMPLTTSVTVNFSSAFDASPVVVLTVESDSDSLVEAMSYHVKSKGLSSFTVRVTLEQAEPVVAISDKFHGLESSLAVVDGHPAIASWPSTTLRLEYIRSLDAAGSEWGDVVVVDTNNNTEVFGDLLVVNGNPAVCYQQRLDDDLYYVRALDATGSAWGEPVVVHTNDAVGWYPSMAIVSGYPAISYYDSTSADLMYSRALDENGAGWGEAVRVSTNQDVGTFPSLAMVNGRPAIAYRDNTRTNLMYVRALDSTGTNGWNSSIAVYTNQRAVTDFTSLMVVDGYPAICFYNQTEDSLMYVWSTNINGGTAWQEPITLGTNGASGSLAIIDGRPAVAFCNDDDDCLMYLRADDASGHTWPAATRITDPGHEVNYVSLAEVDEAPAVSFFSYQATNLLYLRSSDFTSNSAINWIAIEP